MKTITVNKKDYSIPESWDELTRQQLLQVMNALFLKEYKAEELLLKLLHIITGASTKEFLKWKYRLEKSLNEEDAGDLFSDSPEEYFYLLVFLLRPDIDYRRNNLVSFDHGGQTWYGPADGLDNLKMKEFANTENYFLDWCDSEKKDMEALNRLVAILYRPVIADYDVEENKMGDPRELYNYNTSLHYAKSFAPKWPMDVKLAIATWYDGCRRQLINQYRVVFEGEGDPAQFGMVSVMLNVAESNVFGPFKEVEEQHVYLVLMQLSEVVAKAKKMEKK